MPRPAGTEGFSLNQTMLRVRDPAEVAEVVTQRLAGLEVIKNTQTLVAFEVFSQHDLEALFSIGN